MSDDELVQAGEQIFGMYDAQETECGNTNAGCGVARRYRTF